ncbi:hypothetical protein HMI54_005925 [Coelomomyces lativittatus]|nr:hypothetical protein HMI54_005925 [Coelomomyces lativittatus]KAJ1510032.1 hypothetical protein HMI55_007158 [Coelomomyces lativittatus]KAJ1510434.1 hypothetical protein HMI56_006345 [Coelomomyces lativittatus]
MSSSPERVQYERKRRAKCCCCIPIRAGVFILLSMYLLGCVGVITVTSVYFQKIFWLFIANLVCYSLFCIGFIVGITGIFKKSPPMYLFAPITTIVYLIWAITWSIWLFIQIFSQVSDFLKLNYPEHFQTYFRTHGALSYTSLGFSSILNIYYIYVLFRYYSILKKNERMSHRKTELEF